MPTPTPRIDRRRWITLAGATAIVTAGGAIGWRALSGGAAELEIGGPFTLQDGDGHTVTDRDLRGQYLLVYFGYTFCPDICPTTLTEVAGALDRLGPKAERIRPVFITIDPKRDTPRVVGSYVKAFSPRLLGLTGTPEQIASVIRAYRVYAAPHRTGDGPDDYTMDHSSLLYLMRPDGTFEAPIRADQTADPMARDIAPHLT